MKKKIPLLILLFLASLYISAQPAIDWQKCLGGSSSDRANFVQNTIDGGYILAGKSLSNDGDVSGNHGYHDYWIVKLANNGTIEWQQSLGGTHDEEAYSIQQTTDGGFILAGNSFSNNGDVTGNQGLADFWIVKLTNTGSIDWQKSYGGSGLDEATCIQQTIDGGYIVVGGSQSNDGDVSGNHGDFDYWVLKLTSTGQIDWQDSFGGSGYEIAKSVQQTIDEGYVVIGSSYSTDGDILGNQGGNDYWLIKLNSSGAIVWQKSLGGTEHDIAYAVQKTVDGGFLVAGESLSNDGDVSGNHGNYDYWVAKIMSTGDIEWQKSLGGNDIDRATSIQQTTDGGCIVAGRSISNDGDVSGNHGSYDYWVVKLTNSGDIDWQLSLGGTSSDFANSVQQSSDGGYIIVGSSNSTDGDITNNHGLSDFWVVKLEPDDIGVNEIFKHEMPNIFPNPAKNQLNVKIARTLIGNSVYTIYDYTGKAVSSGNIVVENTLIELEKLSGGIYLIKIQTKSDMLTSRFMKE